jgi:hypothetical protein
MIASLATSQNWKKKTPNSASQAKAAARVLLGIRPRRRIESLMIPK